MHPGEERSLGKIEIRGFAPISPAAFFKFLSCFFKYLSWQIRFKFHQKKKEGFNEYSCTSVYFKASHRI